MCFWGHLQTGTIRRFVPSTFSGVSQKNEKKKNRRKSEKNRHRRCCGEVSFLKTNAQLERFQKFCETGVAFVCYSDIIVFVVESNVKLAY